MDDTVIWIESERVFGWLLSRGAHVSLVTYIADGMEYETYIENDDFIEIRDTDE